MYMVLWTETYKRPMVMRHSDTEAEAKQYALDLAEKNWASVAVFNNGTELQNEDDFNQAIYIVELALEEA